MHAMPVLSSPRLLALALASALVAVGCAGGPGWRTRMETSSTCPPSQCEGCGTAPTVTRVMPGDALIGDLRDGCQCFYFEGVEYTLFDIEMVADCCSAPMPSLAITDPEGSPVDLGPCVKGNHVGSKGVVLRKTGLYKGTLCKTGCSEDQHYKLSYELRLAGQDDKK